MPLSRRAFALLPLATPALAQAASLRFLVNATAGGSADLLCRAIADGLRPRLGRPVVPDNRSGAGGFASVLALRGGATDGSLIAQVNLAPLALAGAIYRKPPIDADAELAPICHLNDAPFGLAVRADAPGGGTLQGWLGAMRAKGAAIAVNSATGLPRFQVHMLAEKSGIALTPLIYRSSAAMLPDLEAGHVPAGMTTASEFLELHRAGRLKLLAVSLGEGRWAEAPEVPRFNEQGLPDFVASAWNAVVAPAGTPEAVCAMLAEQITAVLRAPETRQRLAPLGLVLTGGTPAELRARILADRARWAPVIKASGVVADEP
jgi:tripartite-type tricarboxylate transporter receptor subunit TctC